MYLTVDISPNLSDGSLSTNVPRGFTVSRDKPLVVSSVMGGTELSPVFVLSPGSVGKSFTGSLVELVPELPPPHAASVTANPRKAAFSDFNARCLSTVLMNNAESGPVIFDEFLTIDQPLGLVYS